MRANHPRILILAVVAAAAGPVKAELRCTVSKTVVQQFESVGLTVTDSKKGLDISPGPLIVTMADGGDRRQNIHLDPTGKPGVWSGRFTPIRTGRYTGTAVADRADEKEIGLVPLIRVRTGSRRGFVRLNPRSQRALVYSSGGTLFPIGLRLHPDDVRLGTDWRALFARLRSHEVNYVELPVPWGAELPEDEQARVSRSVDTALVEAERTGRLAVQLRLEAPTDLTEEGMAAYEAALGRAARRWAYSPALGVIYVAGADERVPPEARARFVRAVRAADPYRHLVAIPAGLDAAKHGADLRVEPWNWQRPANRHALLEVPDQADGPQPLPGESSWQMLVLGGVGLPLWPYRTGAADGQAVLERIRRLAKVAGSVPYQAGGTLLRNVVALDTPGSFCRYGTTAVGWVVPDAGRILNLSALPKGRYVARFWDPGTDQPAGQWEVWSTGQTARLELPANLRAVYVQVQPAPRRTVRKPAAPKTATKKAPARKTSTRSAAKKAPARKTPTRSAGRRTRRR
jgi:hypothetical protein